MLLISPFDKGPMRNIERRRQATAISSQPEQRWQVIRIVLPELTQNAAGEYIKIASLQGEDAKVAITTSAGIHARSTSSSRTARSARTN